MTQAAANKRKIFDSRYEILSIVGRGSRSVVYHTVTTTEPVEHIALKVLTNTAGDNSASEQLRREALAMVASRHKYTIRLDDFHSLGQISYLAMEYAPHGDLRKYMHAAQGLLPIAQIERFLQQISEALAFMHASGILHRDIKPDNILVVNERQSRLADFGVAILPGEPANIEDLQNGVGTMDYMAPEVLEGIESTKRSDVYLLGVTFYEVLTGVQPFANIPLIEVITRRKTKNITPPRLLRDEMPQYLEDIIMRAIEFDPAKRFESGEDLLQALNKQRALAEQQTASQSSRGEPAAGTNIDTETDQVTDDDLDLDKLLEELAKDLDKDVLNDDDDVTDDSNIPGLAAGIIDKKFTSAESISGQPTSAKPEKTSNRSKKSRRHKRLKSPTTLREHSQTRDNPPSSITKPYKKELADFLNVDNVSDSSELDSAELETGQSSSEIPDQDHQSESSAKFVNQAQMSTDSDDQYTVKENDEQEYDRLENERKKYDNDQLQQDTAPSGSSLSALFANNSSDDDDIAVGQSTDYSNKQNQSAGQQPRHSNQGYQDLYRERDRNKSFGQFRTVGFVLLGVALAYFTLNYLTGSDVDENGQVIGTMSEAQPLFPVVDSNALAFPNLPAGLYVGNMTGLLSKDEIPLMIARAEGSNELVFILAISGFTPARVSLSEIQEERLIVRSGGFILALKGVLSATGQISGTFENSISGEEGTWSVTPVK